MIITTQQLKEQYINYSNPITKIGRDVRQGKLFPLVKGIYETNPNTHGSRIAQFIYGPSYLSFDYVLHYQGLIPEAVYNTFTCATYNKKKIKAYTNSFGTFIYRDVPKAVFSLGVLAFQDGEYSYQVATAEKALCDKLYTLSPVRNVKDLEKLLFEDLRIDINEFSKLNQDELIKISKLYINKSNQILNKWLGGKNNEWNHSTND